MEYWHGSDTQMPYIIQKRAIRIIAASKYNAHTEPLFKQLNLLKACDICKLQELKFYHKLINRQLPKYFERFVGETGGNCNMFHIHAHYVEHGFY